MIKRFLTMLAAALVLFSGCDSAKPEFSVPYKVKDGTVTLKSPERGPGQQSALGMVCAPIDTVRMGFVGLGSRGSGAVKRYTYIEGVKIMAVCDLLPEKVEAVNDSLAARGFPKADEYVGEDAWKKLCEREDIDLVYICTPSAHCRSRFPTSPAETGTKWMACHSRNSHLSA